MVALSRGGAVLATVLAGLLTGACRSEAPVVPDSIAVYRDEMLLRQAQDENARQSRRIEQLEPEARGTGLSATQPARRSLMTMPAVTSQPALAEILEQLPDPSEAAAVYEARHQALVRESREERVPRNFRLVSDYALELLMQIRRPDEKRLSLAECVQRALENNYSIRIASYTPAISQTGIVEAEAAFDSVFFLDSRWDKQDPSVPNRLAVAKSDARSLEGGIRQLLPTGMRAQVSLASRRNFQDALMKGVSPGTPSTPNPVWTTDFVASLTQPLLRGFGLDVNRAQINIAKANHQIAREQFLREVRETLFNVESAYWRLAQARRQAAILAATVAQNKVTYDNMYDHRFHDATEVEIQNARSRWQGRYVSFLESVKNIRDAEDTLKNLLNDPALTLSNDIEIVPSDTPAITPMALDQFAEVRTALDMRSEIAEAKLNIERARIQTAVAKNQTLPQLDLSFSYDVNGLEASADSSFDNMTTNRYRSWSLAAQFSYPLGNRGPRAAHRRARLEEAQAVVALQRATDLVVQEVNEAVRTLAVRFAQIPPSYEASRASERNLRALQARTQRIDPSYLETELNAVERLANDRQALLQVVVEYNIAIVAVERTKGTLTQYNNVVVVDDPGRN